MVSDYAVVGIAGNARTLALENSDSVEVYLPIEAADLPSTAVVVRTSSEPDYVARTAASIARRIDPDLAPDVQLLKLQFRRSLHGAEYGALTVSILGVVALLIACLGIVGLVAFAVAQRTKEIGLRIALGAKPSDVLTAILHKFLLPVVIGLLVGVAGATALSQILRRVLYGISSLDPVTYLAAIGLFAATATVAALLPATRALRVDPMRALRYD
jgi:ABC-type antimicrobial peptide transport system permease subunit